MCLTSLVLLLPLAAHAAEPAGQTVRTESAEASDRLGELVTIPAGRFLMGNNGHDKYGKPEELP